MDVFIPKVALLKFPQYFLCVYGVLNSFIIVINAVTVIKERDRIKIDVPESPFGIRAMSYFQLTSCPPRLVLFRGQ